MMESRKLKQLYYRMTKSEQLAGRKQKIVCNWDIQPFLVRH